MRTRDSLRADAGGGAEPTAQLSLHATGEFTAGALVGGVHNAGHATLFNAMEGDGWTWDWGAFAGGAAFGVAGVVARGLAAGYKMATTIATLPVEQLLVRRLNESISVETLNEIATYRPPPPDGGPEGGPEGGTAAGAETAPGQAAPGAAPVPPAVALLNRLGVPAGPKALRYADGRVVPERLVAKLRLATAMEAAARQAAEPRPGYDRPAAIDDYPASPDTGGKTSGFGVGEERNPIPVRPPGSQPSAVAAENGQRWASRPG